MTQEYDVDQYLWIVIFGAISAMAAAFGIGANDVANAYATSVGSKALTIKQACVLAVIFEFLGALLAGSQVAKTIRKGIADYKCFEDEPELLMWGSACVCAMVAVWLILASYLEMPVSTTHSAVGGMVGMTIVLKGAGCVIWSAEGDEENLYLPRGVSAIVMSWVISPVLSAIFAVLLFLSLRFSVLRAKNSFRNSIRFYPLLVFVAVLINSFFIISKGISKKICPSDAEDVEWICQEDDEEPGTPKGKVDAGIAIGVSAAIALVCAILTIPVARYIEKSVNALFDLSATTTQESSPECVDIKCDEVLKDVVDVEKVDVKTLRSSKPESKGKQVFSKVSNMLTYNMNQDIHEGVTHSATVTAIHENAEKFDAKTEAVFRYIQIFTAICDSFAHGANDVANAVGPFMGLYAIYLTGTVTKKSDAAEDNAMWILAVGGIFIGIGLLLYGYKIMRAIGVKLAVITPSRGATIELGAAIVIIMGSFLGLPLSTTHCQIGATTGVALLEGKKGVNKWVLFKTVIGWIVTLVVVGGSTGLLVAFGAHAPLAVAPRNALFNDRCGSWAADNGYSNNLTLFA